MVIIIRDAALALQVLHDHDIVHRDVKPNNLVLTSDGKRVVLMDFGLIKCASLTNQSALTVPSGSLRYSSPEQLASGTVEVGPQTDVRSLGVVMWELLTRKRLFANVKDDVQLGTAVFQQDVPLLRSIDRGFESDLEAIVARATERRVADRIQSAGKFAEYLDAYLDHESIDLHCPGKREMIQRWFRRHKLAGPLVAIAAFACIVTFIAWFFYNQNQQAMRQVATTLKVPLGLGVPLFPADNPLTPARIELGKMLFFDKRLSKDNSMSCASCHDPEHGFARNKAIHIGMADVSGMFPNELQSVARAGHTNQKKYPVSRDAPTVVNVSYLDRLFLDGRARSLESHALQPILNQFEMGMDSPQAIVDKLQEISGYVALFEEAFASDSPLNAKNVAMAIAAYERTLLAGDSPYDRYREAETKYLASKKNEHKMLMQSSMSKDAIAGLEIFRRVGCTKCHVENVTGDDRGLLTDNKFHNIGVAYKDDDSRDPGRIFQSASALENERFAFRTPSLRDVHRSAPYMHNGQFATLDEVIEYYSKGGSADPKKSEVIVKLDLSTDNKRKLIVSLRKGLASDQYPSTEKPQLPE